MERSGPGVTRPEIKIRLHQTTRRWLERWIKHCPFELSRFPFFSRKWQERIKFRRRHCLEARANVRDFELLIASRAVRANGALDSKRLSLFHIPGSLVLQSRPGLNAGKHWAWYDTVNEQLFWRIHVRLIFTDPSFSFDLQWYCLSDSIIIRK